MSSEYPAQLAPLVARSWKARVAPAPVSLWAIRAWCAAIGIDEARFRGPDDRPGDIVAPPPMLQCWAGAGLSHGDPENAPLHAEVRRAFADAGFGAVVATDYEQEYLADLRPGDIVHEAVRIADISPLKRTNLGDGHFVTIEFRFATAAGMDVGLLRVRTLYFDPGTASPRTARPTSPVQSPVSAPCPPATVPVTVTLVVAGSIASNDFEAVHHDPAAARASGLDDIILSIITTAGLVFGYGLDLAEPSWKPSRLKLRLGAPGMPGDSLVLHGVWADADEERTLNITGDVQRGRHVQAQIVFSNEQPK